MKLPLSVFIITQNEADRLPITIRSCIAWVDEVVVVDSGSTDGTPEVAVAEGARICHRDWTGYGPQKRFAETQCGHAWLLNLDADEEVTPELAKEIQSLFMQGEPPKSGYILPVRDVLPGETRISRFAHTNRCLRLYDRRCGRFSDSPVHDSVIMTAGETGHLKGAVIHRSFRSIGHAIEKMNAYAAQQAEDMHRRGKRMPRWRLYVEFPAAFAKIYFLRLYFMRGRKGFCYAVVYAFSRFTRCAKYFEKAGRG